MGKNKPFAGKRVPDSNTRAPRRPGASKRGAAAGDGSGGGGSGGGGGKRSTLSLLGSALGLAALWAWQLWQGSQERSSEGDVLAAMLRKPLYFTQHGACRMDCRHIGRHEVEQTLRTGRVNARKSEPALLPCPKYVVDAAVQGKNLQGVFAACAVETKVITVIDRDTNWACGPC